MAPTLTRTNGALLRFEFAWTISASFSLPEPLGPVIRTGADESATLTASEVRCRYDSDESLLGGAVVQIGSTVYDGSVSGQVETLRQRLTE